MRQIDSEKLNDEASEDFISRWSRRKQASVNMPVEAEAVDVDLATAEEAEIQLCDEDMPPIDSLDETSDYTGFLSPKVSEELRRIALRKLFHGAGFNVCDGLDDYDEDFSSFAKLGNIITWDMRHQMEEARKKLEQQSDSGDDKSAEAVSETESAAESSDAREQDTAVLQDNGDAEDELAIANHDLIEGEI